MKKFLLLSFTALLMIGTSAQEKKGQKKPTHPFKYGGIVTLMGGQSGSRNWTPAGSEKFTLAAYGNLLLWANKSWNKNKWTNQFEAAYALINTSSEGVRKIDDKLELYSKYKHDLKNNWGIGGVANIRTQFVNGYDYTEAIPKRISGFFAPAYIVASPGVQFDTKNDAFSIHLGPDVRWVFTTNSPYSLTYQGGVKPDGTKERTLSDLYGVNPRQEIRIETGLYLSAMFKKEIFKNVTWKTRLDASNDITRNEPFLIDVYWTNAIAMKVNNWLSANYNFDLYYDDDVKMFGANKDNPATQIKSLLGVGLAVKF